jgi:tRNA (guanine-N7-)-methyltransferase
LRPVAAHPPPARPQRFLYGRRKGRKLNSGRSAALAALLPALGIPEGEEPLDLPALFPRPVAQVWLEIGFGAGEHLLALAGAHPGIGFIGAEPFENGVAAFLARVRAENLANVRVFADDARLLLARLPEASIGRLFVLFPDPWPKTRHHKRRMIGPGTIPAFARILTDGAELRFASDAADYVDWVLEHMAAAPQFALASRARGADWPETRYEAKARATGRACAYLTFVRKARDPRKT